MHHTVWFSLYIYTVVTYCLVCVVVYVYGVDHDYLLSMSAFSKALSLHCSVEVKQQEDVFVVVDVV